ncbi:MAG TPA: MerR family transcriptional regulator [Candidatus Ligilactobacillus excrementipullorum]|nr:MerR family transcriptional regulator [Candidatus Ligilactobacillus excrementipullorum]
MEYTIKKFAQLSGVSARTLRYYDEIDLLKPARINSAGYRIYGAKEVERLQQILFYRQLDLQLAEIKNILDAPDFDVEQALNDQWQQLSQKKADIERLLTAVEQTLDHYQGEKKMSDQEKFMAFKKQKITENESKYGAEIRTKYGEKTIDASNQRFLNSTAAQLQEKATTEQQLFEKLQAYVQNPQSDLAKEIFDLHKQWLSYTWTSYSAEAHRGLGLMYVSDERFTRYYDRHFVGAAQALNDIIQQFAH